MPSLKRAMLFQLRRAVLLDREQSGGVRERRRAVKEDQATESLRT